MTLSVSSLAPSPPSPWGKLFGRTRAAFAVLAVLSVVLVMWQRYGMERVITLDAHGTMFADDDRSPGGASVATLEQKDGTARMRCEAVQKFAYPYCAMAFMLPIGGIDLSGFDRITVDASYDGPGPAQFRLRLYTYENGLTREGDWITYKTNEVAGPPLVPGQDITIPIKWISVAQWWRDQTRPPLDHSYTRLDKVARIDIVTPMELKPGTHWLTVHSLRLHGKWIGEKDLLVVLVCSWVVFTLAWVSAAAVITRKELDEGKVKLALLNEINRALELEAMELAGQAYTDPLTGALNRQGLRDALMRSSTLLAPPTSVIFADIDHFKRINDTHGHGIGDEVLKLFAQRVRAAVRASDCLVRWGGEEFLIVCQGTDAYHATALADKLRETLKRQPWPRGIAVTSSFGVAQRRADEAIGAVIERADAQLYKAKDGGRDRVASEVDAADIADAHPVERIAS